MFPKLYWPAGFYPAGFWPEGVDLGDLEGDEIVIEVAAGEVEVIVGPFSGKMARLNLFVVGDQAFKLLTQISEDESGWYTVEEVTAGTVTADSSSTSFTKAGVIRSNLPALARVIVKNTSGSTLNAIVSKWVADDLSLAA